MTRDDFQRFLDRVGASSLGDYLGKAGREEAIAALEEKVAWAVAHRNDAEQAEVADFIARNADGLRSVLDEGEQAWWERTETSPRVRKPESGEWRDLDSFATPAPPERANPTIVADETPDVPRPALRRGRNLPDDIVLPEAIDTPITPILPEAVDTPGTPVRGQAPPLRDDTATVEAPSDETWVDDGMHLDPDPTDPIGFTAIPLSAAERERDMRLATGPTAGSPRQPAVTFGLREIGDDEPTDPSMPRLVLTPPRPPKLRPASAPRMPAWVSTAVMVVGVIVMILGTVAILFVIARVGRQQGRTFAEEAWKKAHVTSTTTVETPPEPTEPAPAPAPEVIAPAPVPVVAPAPAPMPPLALAGSTWVGTGGTGPLTLKIDVYEGGALRGRLIRTTGGIAQTTPVTGTWDEGSGAFVLGGDGVAMTGTLQGSTARGTWAPDGTSHQWLLARQ